MGVTVEVADFDPPVEVTESLVDYMQRRFPIESEQIERLLREREAVGIKTYGKSLSTFNGRSASQDALEEALDLLLYLHQWELELWSGKSVQAEREFGVHLLVHSAARLVMELIWERERGALEA